MITPQTRKMVLMAVEQLMNALDKAGQEAIGKVGAMKIKDAAPALGISTRQVYNLVQQKKLVQVGKTITTESMAQYTGTTPHVRRRLEAAR